ncbi:MAG: transposase [Chlorobiaceae bacterium]
MAMEAEIKVFMERYASMINTEGKVVMVCNGYLPARKITSSTAPVTVKGPRSRATIDSLKPFFSALIPRYMRKSIHIEEAVPLFYFGGLSNNDFIPAFEKLFGELLPGFFSASVTLMKQLWLEKYRCWNKRDLSLSRNCYLGADGIRFNLRLDEGHVSVCWYLSALLRKGNKNWWRYGGGNRENSESGLEVPA